MDLPDWASIILLLFFLLMSAFYSATETAFACLNKYKFQIEAEDGKTSSKLIVKLYEHFETTLITVLIGNNLFAVLISTVSTFLFLHLFHGILNDSVVSLIASIIMAIITFMFGDTIPKFVAKRAPNIVARIVAFPTAFFVILFFPISLVFRGFEWLTRKIFRAKPEADFTDEDFAQEIERKEKEGELEENESDIIVNSIDFGDTAIRVRPRPQVSMDLRRYRTWAIFSFRGSECWIGGKYNLARSKSEGKRPGFLISTRSS